MNTPTLPMEPLPRDRQALKRMRLYPITLRFSSDCAHLESAFQKDDIETSIDHMRVVLVLAALLFAAFGILDAFLLPEQKKVTWTIRFAFVCPYILLVVFLSRYHWGQQKMQAMMASSMVVAGGAIIVMIVIAPPPANYSYYAGLILIFIFGYTGVRLQFLWASSGAWIVVVLYEIVAIAVVQTPLPVLMNNNFFFISANLIGMLGKLGYRVTAVASGEQAVKYLAEHEVDILIVDMVMDPGMDGCATYRRIVETHPGQRAIIASGFSESERVREVQRLGAGQYIKKPYTLENIGVAVRNELDRRRVRNR